MTHIRVREKADSTTAYKPEVTVPVDGARCKRTATFGSRTTDNRWVAKNELRAPGGNMAAHQPSKPATRTRCVR